MDDGTRLRRPTNARVGPRLAAASAVVAVVLLVLCGCSGGGDSRSSSAPTTTPKTTVDIPLGDVSAASAGPDVSVSADQSQRVIDALTTYVKGATVDPLRTGKPATTDFSGVFDAATLATATTTDRGVVLDEGLPKVTGALTVKAQPVAIVGLGDQGGNLTLVSAALATDTTATTKVKGGPLHIVRKADFVLQPDPTGTWKITAYNMVVTREGAGLTPTTTRAPATTKGTK